jgi:N-methylhydantoinase A
VFAAHGYAHPIHLMTSGGSLAALETAARFPIRLVESGPAGGAILAADIAAERDEARIVSFDMGGTTAKLCLIDHGRPMLARTFEIDRQSRFMKGSGFPVRIPVIEMVEIGAGGGSIAHVDALRRVVVGPESAGSEPGPACYGRGGTRPAVTDADVTLGRIDPKRFAGGRIALDVEAAARALAEAVGAPLGLDATAAALAVSEIVDENMANAARVHAVERGASLTERTLIAFGGAAPLHASRLAEKLGIRRIIVPADADVGSAVGFLTAPAAYDLIRSRYMRLNAFNADAANDLLAEMGRDARGFALSAAGGRAITETRSAFMRYAGQGHEIAVELPDRPLTGDDAAGLRGSFETAYRALFARHIPGAAIEIMSWVVVASTGRKAATRLPKVARSDVRPTPIGTRTVVDPRTAKPVSAAIYVRADLQPGMTIEGPCLVVEPGTSTYVSPTFECGIDAGFALVLTARA